MAGVIIQAPWSIRQAASRGLPVYPYTITEVLNRQSWATELQGAGWTVSPAVPLVGISIDPTSEVNECRVFYNPLQSTTSDLVRQQSSIRLSKGVPFFGTLPAPVRVDIGGEAPINGRNGTGQYFYNVVYTNELTQNVDWGDAIETAGGTFQHPALKLNLLLAAGGSRNQLNPRLHRSYRQVELFQDNSERVMDAIYTRGAKRVRLTIANNEAGIGTPVSMNYRVTGSSFIANGDPVSGEMVSLTHEVVASTALPLNTTQTQLFDPWLYDWIILHGVAPTGGGGNDAQANFVVHVED